MPALLLPDPPLSDGVVGLRGFESGEVAARTLFAAVTALVVRRPECDHRPDLFLARLRG